MTPIHTAVPREKRSRVVSMYHRLPIIASIIDIFIKELILKRMCMKSKWVNALVKIL